MGTIIQLPPPSRPRGEAPASGAQILLFTGVWRERYETTPADILPGKRWSAAKRCSGATTADAKIKGRGTPKGPKAPSRGKKRA